MKQLLLLVASIFFFSAIVSCGSKEQGACIKYVIEQDSVLGGIRNKMSLDTSLSEAITWYVKSVRELDKSGCSGQFKNAIETHLRAWEDMLPVTNKFSEQRAEMHVLFDRLRRSADSVEFDKRLKKIWSTWSEVVRKTPT